ncbi:trypsin-like peptidase domain-containing protein [Roseibium sp. FZY0029]|uniref:trypsin-like peptidase domain-containing protein n=1 Tax=Roseibium sp. FZY0029 TaxID=3116647 RepID=UPI002EC93517|nr:trypsin-like peptidase domain-containing protein [Roseibium sp. FZY0029]
MAAKHDKLKTTAQPTAKSGFSLKGRTRSMVLRDAMRARAVMKDNLPALRVAVDYTVTVPDPGNPDMAAFTAGNTVDGSTLLTMLAVVSRSVCRIDRVIGDDRLPVGTGILIAPDKIMTCRHVLRDCNCSLADFGENGRRWQMPNTGSIEAVFGAQPLQASVIRPIDSVIYGDNDSGRRVKDTVLEVAIAKLGPLQDGELQPGDPLALFKNDSQIASRAAIAVIGFPGPDAETAAQLDLQFKRDDDTQPVTEAIRRIFGTNPDLEKRNMLIGVGTLEETGSSREATRYCKHFAPTMPGMSGGAVIDLATGSLIGLHAAGSHFRDNRFHLFGPMLRFLSINDPCRKDIEAL